MTDNRDNWFEEWFNHIYLKVYAHRDDKLAETEVDFLIEVLEPDKQDRILDLCCGAGRHLKRLDALGYRHAVGMDLSEDLLRKAQTLLPGRVGLIRGDMRSLPFNSPFKVVVSLFTSFGYFSDEEENMKVLREIRRVLARGGKFLLDLVPLASVDRLVARSEKEVEGLLIVEKRRFDAARRRIEKEIEIEMADGKRTFFESVRVYSFGETRKMLAEAGLCLTEVCGDFGGGVFQPDSERMILIGKTTEV
ncbi:MAG: class I SAM-dependent methyltransferase [Candidatus Omnitrophica bacterium]|jgi:SAM-dependent methyltransferase|nr:MAG: Cypemycin methyltransferase [Candidatus Hinthialibacteria bacterium OLB16]MBE7488010.1 class I SAM-dependent methyltransferase [bacterium]MBK7496345.1 class I SAM-dependent methyltransferase [Candidatus Omnitrophota bacterium]MCE7909427.1 class I SAM-dependent methyltransferase [Candidatus Omnitrophica bacterium COP1]MBV6482189.1 Ubiquinone/menaquinone biosynthesis C-methyltransferase UbiE [bacterium]